MRIPLGFHQYTTTASAKDFTDAATFTIPPTARYVWLSNGGAGNIFWRDDGTAPTAGGIGMILPPISGQQQPFEYWFGNAAGALAFKFIGTAPGALLDASFYK
jgi:hypothetical protein